MAIKVNFADAFLQSYGPGAQQGAAQWQQMQRQKAQEQQFQIERADATARYEQEHALRQGQLANQTAQNTREQAAFDTEQADMRTASQGAESLAAGVPDPHKRIADISGFFKSPDARKAFVTQETAALTERERNDARQSLSLKLREAKGKPQIANDAVLAGQMELVEEIAANPDADPIALLKEADSIYEQSDKRTTGLKRQARYAARLQPKIDRWEAIADGLEDAGDLEGAAEIHAMLDEADAAWTPGENDPEKAYQGYSDARKILYSRSGGKGSKSKEAEGPLTYQKAYEKAEVTSTDVKVMNENLRAIAYDEVFGRTGSEEEAEKAAKKVRGLTLSQMRDMEAKRLVSRDAQDRQGPRESGQAQGQAQAPQQMNGAAQAQPSQAQQPAGRQPSGKPPSKFDARPESDQQGFIEDVVNDIKQNAGTGVEAIYQRWGVAPGLSPTVKALIQRSVAGGK